MLKHLMGADFGLLWSVLFAVTAPEPPIIPSILIQVIDILRLEQGATGCRQVAAVHRTSSYTSSVNLELALGERVRSQYTPRSVHAPSSPAVSMTGPSPSARASGRERAIGHRLDGPRSHWHEPYVVRARAGQMAESLSSQIDTVPGEPFPRHANLNHA